MLEELYLEQIGFRGDTVARADDQVYFVAGGIPGERVVAEILGRRDPFVNAVVREVLEPSPRRVEAPCPYYGTCGGCQWQHIAYDKQLELKRQIVHDQLQRKGGFAEPPVRATVGMEEPWYYRNQARFSVDDNGQLGFMQAHEKEFLRIDHCMLMHPKINEVLETLQERAHVKHQLTVRCGFNTDSLLVAPAILEGEALPFPTGQRYFEEALLGRRFRVFASSFFQTNTRQAERLASLVMERLALTGEEVVVDAYCGVGAFALLIAEAAARVIGIEVSAAALEDARYNARDVENVEFIQGATEAVLPELTDRDVDAVILDPSRKGCDKKVIDALKHLGPPTVIYVSCDPGTLARDLAWLCEGDYELIEAQPVDMFPQTYHTEVVTTIRRRCVTIGLSSLRERSVAARAAT